MVMDEELDFNCDYCGEEILDQEFVFITAEIGYIRIPNSLKKATYTHKKRVYQEVHKKCYNGKSPPMIPSHE